MGDYTYQEIKLNPEPFVLEVSEVQESAQPLVKKCDTRKNKDDPPKGEKIVQHTINIKDLTIMKVNLEPTEFILNITETKVYFL
jgi:hypothetical protein